MKTGQNAKQPVNPTTTEGPLVEEQTPVQPEAPTPPPPPEAPPTETTTIPTDEQGKNEYAIDFMLIHHNNATELLTLTVRGDTFESAYKKAEGILLKKREETKGGLKWRYTDRYKMKPVVN